jgi:OMF family outer membrane factor
MHNPSSLLVFSTIFLGIKIAAVKTLAATPLIIDRAKEFTFLVNNYSRISPFNSDQTFHFRYNLSLWSDKQSQLATDSINFSEVSNPTLNNYTLPLIKPYFLSLDPLSNLNPNSDPLVIPTQPQQVEIKETVLLTLEQAIQLANRNNRELKIVQLQLERSRASLDAEEAALFPSLSLDGNLTRNLDASGEIQVEAQRDQQEEQIQQQSNAITALEAQIAQTNDPIERAILQSQLQQAQTSQNNALNNIDDIDNFATTTINGTVSLQYAIFSPIRQASIRFAKEQLRIDELEVERIQEQLRLNVATAYYDLQQADQEVEIAQRDVESRQENLENIRALLDAALATKLDLLNAEVELDNAIQVLRIAEAQQKTARRNIAQILSLPSSVTPVAADPVEIGGEWNLSLEETIILALKNRVELEQQLAQRRSSKAQRQIALAAIKPQVALFADYNLLQAYSDQPGDFVPRGFGDGYSFGLNFNWTLFDGGAAAARAREADADIAIAEQQFATQAEGIRFDVEQAFFQLPANLQNVKTATEAIKRAQEAVKAARRRFQANVNTQTEVLDAQNRLVQAENNLVQAILDYNRALVGLERAVSNLQ